MKKFKDFIKEDATITAGNTGGMGPVVSSQPGNSPGETGTIGSGDIGAALGTFTKKPANIYKKKKKKKEKVNEFKDNIKGGLSDNMTISDIAKKHNTDIKTIQNQIKKGEKVESEHTSSKKIAKEIAKDHEVEDELYYDHLDNMEKNVKKMKRIKNFENFEQEIQVDNFTARYYDNFDDEDMSKYRNDINEDLVDYYTFECSGSPMPYFKTKADFFDFMEKNGFKHTTLTKKTDMLIVTDKDQGTLKVKKAEKYGVPVYTYKQARVKVKEMASRVSKYNL